MKDMGNAYKLSVGNKLPGRPGMLNFLWVI
jgi:hypothetical protein